jgi:uncharacterized phage-associated protein
VAPISALSAARTLCERSGWTLTNLELQKMLYLAQMVYMGEHDGEPLFSDPIEAWDLGPVVPDVYRRVRAFGAQPIQDVFFGVPKVDDAARLETLNAAVDQLRRYSAAQLVSITHDRIGAWYKNYRAGARNVVIPDADILEEFEKRRERRKQPA